MYAHDRHPSPFPLSHFSFLRIHTHTDTETDTESQGTHAPEEGDVALAEAEHGDELADGDGAALRGARRGALSEVTTEILVVW